LRLVVEVTFDDMVKPICIRSPTVARQHDFDREGLFVTGWGKTKKRRESIIKQYAEVPYVNIGQCNQLLRSNLSTSLHICAGGQAGIDSCRGDSGGPLMQKDDSYMNLVGIVSYGAYKCGTLNSPGIYTKVDEFYNWIVEHLEP
jgi:secreted trypsin-like serine protease